VEKVAHQECPIWYAVTTKSRQEKVAASMLDYLDIAHFLPLVSEERQWSDRKQTIAAPLFPGYIFVHIARTNELQLQVLKIPGLVDFVRNSAGPLSVSDHEVESVRAMVESGVKCLPHPFFKCGDRVRVVRGPLQGLMGDLIRSGSQSKLVISIQMIQRSVAAVVLESDVELAEGVTSSSSFSKHPLFKPSEASRQRRSSDDQQETY
jgi:transcription termination/antitermination protein NusG